MKRRSPFLLVLLALVFAPRALTAVVPDLYQVTVPVSGQSQENLATAARAGLEELLVRISGKLEAPRETAVRSALANAGRYLEQYRFDRSAGADGQVAPVAILRFASEPVDALLRSAGLPVWGGNRPVVMMWLAKDETEGRSIISENSHPELVHALREQARRRGVLLRFPLLDLDDLAAVSADEVWRLDGLALADASRRYRADAVLGGRASQLSDGRWLGSWRLAMDEARVAGDVEAASPEAYAQRMVDALAVALAERYAAVAQPDATDGDLQLSIDGVASLRDYTGVLTYLNQLGQARDVTLVALDEERLRVQLTAEGGREQLQRAFALDRRLEPIEATGPASDDVLHYRWRSAQR